MHRIIHHILKLLVWLLSIGTFLFIQSCASTTSTKRYQSKPATEREIKALEEEAEKSEAEIEPSSPSKSSSLKKISHSGIERLQEEINQYLGTPYRYGGEKFTGMDCSGFVMRVYQDAIKLKLPRTSSAMAQFGEFVSQTKLKFGDLVFFRIKSSKISHVGIYIGEGEFVHSSSSLGVTVSKLSDKYYQKHYALSRRVIETE
ncbi:MAG: C40 family peptidase [Chloroherpetonaceae bacterium]|nr:C40 family peptidase [Chloroherpetonaceae bacterium]